jgi:hypothetical protein
MAFQIVGDLNVSDDVPTLNPRGNADCERNHARCSSDDAKLRRAEDIACTQTQRMTSVFSRRSMAQRACAPLLPHTLRRVVAVGPQALGGAMSSPLASSPTSCSPLMARASLRHSCERFLNMFLVKLMNLLLLIIFDTTTRPFFFFSLLHFFFFFRLWIFFFFFFFFF